MATLKIDPALMTGSWADAILGPIAPYTGHGHGEKDCKSCEEVDRCDCACGTCVGVRLEAAKIAIRPISFIQAALDREWEMANFSGPGCPFCDALISCSCWEERKEMHKAEERRRVRADRAEIAARIRRGECACDAMSQDPDYPSLCEVCVREEELRCRECGELECRTGCCGGCGGCSNCLGDPCKGCGEYSDRCCCWEDEQGRESPCDCGACEEHNDSDNESRW